MQGVHLVFDFGFRPRNERFELFVRAFADFGVAYDAAEIFIAHRDGAGNEVAQHVRKVGIIPLGDEFPGNLPVIVEGHFVQDEITDGVHAVQPRQVVGIDDVALGFGHFPLALQEPGMTEHLFGQRLPHRHEEDRPIDGVETDDVLADEVQIGPAVILPIFLIQFAVIAVGVESDARDIVDERVQPDIDDVLLVEIHGNAPLERGTGHAQILQALFQEVIHHLVLAGYGLNELGVFFDVLDETVGIFAHFEEIRLLAGGLDLSAAIGALAVDELALRPERFARRAIHALVRALIDVALFVKLAENFLYFPDMVLIRCADEIVIGRIHEIPYAADLRGHFVDVFLGGHARRRGLLFDLLSVFVRARLEIYVVPLRALEPRDGVGENDLIGIADVRLTRRVGNRRGDVIGTLFVHGSSSLLVRLFSFISFVLRSSRACTAAIQHIAAQCFPLNAHIPPQSATLPQKDFALPSTPHRENDVHKPLHVPLQRTRRNPRARSVLQATKSQTDVVGQQWPLPDRTAYLS